MRFQLDITRIPAEPPAASPLYSQVLLVTLPPPEIAIPWKLLREQTLLSMRQPAPSSVAMPLDKLDVEVHRVIDTSLVPATVWNPSRVLAEAVQPDAAVPLPRMNPIPAL